jgi:hypothetical protein
MSGSKAVRAGTFAVTLAISACLGDFHLSASSLDIGPNPAAPGDVVVASFFLTLAPLQRYTVIVLIDGTEHQRETRSDAPPRPYVITLGDAADLISTYGTGVHSVRIEVRAEEEGETTRTQSVNLELREAVPEEGT